MIFDVDIGEMPEDSYEWDDGSGWLASMASLRADLLSGDLRVLYLAWLIDVQWGTVFGDEVEPLPGIGKMNGDLEAFAGFFRIDPGVRQICGNPAINWPHGVGVSTTSRIDCSLLPLSKQ